MTKIIFIILYLFSFNALASGTKLSELQKETKADNDGKLYLESPQAFDFDYLVRYSYHKKLQ